MTYDSRARGILLVGGRDGDSLLSDLWSRDGQSWRLLEEDGPIRRGIYASAYDAARGLLIFHGSGDLDETGWRLESSTWGWSDRRGWSRLHPTADR